MHSKPWPGRALAAALAALTLAAAGGCGAPAAAGRPPADREMTTPGPVVPSSPASTPGALSVGEWRLPVADGGHPLLVLYPSADPARVAQRGPYRVERAVGGTPAPGNGRLVLISHGTGGAPWVHADLAHALVRAGYTVGLLSHRGDTYGDSGDQGSFASPKRRPLEVSAAIDAVAADPRFAPRLDLRHVGVYGLSAGGMTALTLAGGRWSAQRFVQHCDAHLADDWFFCTGVITSLDGGWLDGFKQWVARHEIHRRFDDDHADHGHTDPRVVAVVAAVPAAAPFDLDTLRSPRVPLGLVTVGADRWLPGRFHAEAVLAACQPRCERVAHVAEGGHGAYLSPPPPGLTGVLGDMLNDPPGFDRAALPAVERAVVAYFDRHLRR